MKCRTPSCDGTDVDRGYCDLCVMARAEEALREARRRSPSVGRLFVYLVLAVSFLTALAAFYQAATS